AVAWMLKLLKLILSPSSEPSIFLDSVCTLSSSPGINGTILLRISRLDTPGYPAPETDCMEVTTRDSIPKASCKGLSDMVNGTETQFGLLTIHPLPSLLKDCFLMSSA